MISTILIIAAVLALLVFLGQVIRGSVDAHDALGEWQNRRCPVDIGAFRALTDPAEECFLRKSLSSAQFRSAQRRRTVVARQLLKNVSVNAILLVRIGEQARSSHDQETSCAAEQLIREALQVRINTLAARQYLLLKWIFPIAMPALLMKLAAYQQSVQHMELILRRGQLASAALGHD